MYSFLYGNILCSINGNTKQSNTEYFKIIGNTVSWNRVNETFVYRLEKLLKTKVSNMDKLLILDLDGVLIDSRELHYTALNTALKQVANIAIDRDVHLSKYDGLTTTQKLKNLTEDYGLDPSLYNQIWNIKQKNTRDLIASTVKKDDKLIIFLKKVKKQNIKIACCSNSIVETIKQSLLSLGIDKLVDAAVSGNEVSNCKPHPEIYWNAMSQLTTIPEKTIILEDSHIGRLGALRSGAKLYKIEDVNCLKSSRVQNEIIDEFNQIKDTVDSLPWNSTTLNVVIPMAGNGKRFVEKGYSFPKPLIDVKGVPMIERVVDNLNIFANYIFIIKKEHDDKYNLKKYINDMMDKRCYNIEVIVQDEPLQGAAATVLLAKKYINNDDPIVIANSDQLIKWNSNECMYAFKHEEIDGGILTFKNSHPKWSYAEIGDNGFVSRVAEKELLPGNNATVGVYYWQKGSDFVRYAEQMIEKDIRVNNEFYVCPVFNEAINDNKKIRVKKVNKMWGIGTPEDLEEYLRYE